MQQKTPKISRQSRRAIRRRNRRNLRLALGGLFEKNPVLASGLIIAPVVVAAVSLRTATALSIAMALICIPAIIVSGLISRWIPYWVTAVTATAVSTAMIIPAYLCIAPLSVHIFDALGIYFPIMAVSSLPMAYISGYRRRPRPMRWIILQAVCLAVGFAAVAFLMGGLREFIGYGTLWGFPLNTPLKITGVQLPFFGFILLGFIAAGLQGIKVLIHYIDRKKRDAQEAKTS